MEGCRSVSVARFPLAAALLFAIGCATAQPSPQVEPAAKTVNLTGEWQWEQGQESLDLKLKQDGAVITGYHSAVGQRGMKVDEVTEDSGPPSINGELNGSVATVKFHSGFPDSTGGGTARLTLRGSFLYWQIVKSDGEHYLPKNARLSRVKKRNL